MRRRRSLTAPAPAAAVRRVAALALVLAGCWSPPLARQGSIAIVEGFALPVIGGGQAAFVTFRNDGELADTVRMVASPIAATVTLHRTEVHQGMARMTESPRIVVEPRATVAMRSGGLHLMLGGVTRELGPGDSLPLEIELARAGRIAVMVPVVAFGKEP